MKPPSEPDKNDQQTHQIRREAERRLARSDPRPGDLSGKSQEEIIHELQVHQIELEIQNEELKRAQQQSEISRDQYIDLYDFSPIGYITLTKDALISEVNLTGATMLGVVRQHLIHTHFRKYVSPGYQDQWDNFFLAGIKQGKKQTCELELKRQDGHEFSARIKSIRIDTGNGSYQVRIIMSDVTDRRKVEEEIQISEIRYRRLFESAQDGILILDRETGEITDSNPFIETLTGYPKEELIGKPLWDIGFIKDKIASKVAFEELQKNDYIRYEDLPLKTKAGKRIDVEFISNVYHTGFHTSVIQCNIRDITERKRAETALYETSQKLRLLTGLTRHDILNQLTAIGLLHDLALETSEPAEIKEYISRAKVVGGQIEATIGFTRDYENFGTVSSGWQRIHPIVESAKTEVSLGSITIENRIPEDLEIYADPIIRKVFSTLMENAIRHGEGISGIQFSWYERDNSQIITCKDDGVGIPVKEKEYIFGHGYGKHTGIGLFITREILSITGLSIREVGVPGKGAEFEIIIPAGKFRRAA